MPRIDSNRRDNFTTSQVGDAHLRGLRISLNNTFSAGGRSAPIFACIFGLKPSEMPGDEIIVCKCKGLVVSVECNGTMKEGFIVFIRGNYNISDDSDDSVPPPDTNPLEENMSSVQESNNPRPLSKESCEAKIYRDLVYYPFINEIRVNDYDMDPDVKVIPSNLTAVSWMDGCHGQLKLITTEDVLDTEKKAKIITCKHSAARTSVEQAAGVGPMFKMMKSAVKKMAPTNSGSSPLFVRLSGILEDLQTPTEKESGRIVKLPAFKKINHSWS